VETETGELYNSSAFGIFLSNIITIEPYNFEPYRLKVRAFLRHSVYC